MKKKEIYEQLLENYSLQKSEAITFINHRIGVAVDKTKMLDTISANIDKLSILCGDLKLELRLHEANPLLLGSGKQFYTVSQASEILDMSESKIRDLISSGKIECKKINQRNWKIPNWSLEAYKSDLCNFLEAQEESVSNFAVVDILGDEHNLLLSLITKEGIHLVYEYATRVKRKVADVYADL